MSTEPRPQPAHSTRLPLARRHLVMLLALTLVVGGLRPAAAAERLVRVASVGPWPAVSGLIGYRGRVWFVNSVKWSNHNSADVYSYDPRSGKHRYEAHLFSQDTGDPVVARGLLYWPSEDSRWSTGRGEFMVTDGRRWRWGYLPRGRAFHLHTMAAHGGVLYAAISAWRAKVLRSADGGATWHMVYDHGTPRGRVSRIISMATFKGSLYAGLVARYRQGIRLLRGSDAGFTAVEGWPEGTSALALTPWRGHLYAVNARPGGRAVFRTAGPAATAGATTGAAKGAPKGTQRVRGLDGLYVRDLAAGPKALWAISVGDGDGALWRSPDGSTWQKMQAFRDAEPADLLIYGGRPYVGAQGRDGKGSLWGPPAPAALEPAAPPGPMPRPPAPLAGTDVPRDLALLAKLLDDPRSYPGHGPRILAVLRRLALSGDPSAGRGLTALLGRGVPPQDLRMFGGNVVVPSAKMARWYMMWAIAMNGHGRVPPALIGVPWGASQNRAEKYLEPAPGAAWAVARLGQKDAATVRALVMRLERQGDPVWLKGDMVGALSALTGQRFGYDAKAWRAWLDGRHPGGAKN